jgi:spermidine synthase
MIVELAAVRLLAPWFGTSMTVWTNVIAVILLALSLGYALAARLSPRVDPLRALGWTLLLGGPWVCWLPWLAPSLAKRVIPEGLALHEVGQLLGWGSLAVSALVFLPPAAALGMVCPLVAEALARLRHLSAGTAGGAVLFASTAGSLAGVFSTSHLLIPGLGIRRTYWLAGGLILACGLLALVLGRRSRWLPGLAAALVALGGGLTPRPRARVMDGTVEIASRESPYQTLRVVDEVAEPSLRYLQVNEGLDSFQSVGQATPGLFPDGFYYNDFLLPLCWDVPEPDWSVLVLGLGAGSVAQVFSQDLAPTARLIGIELDPVIVDLGLEYFGLGQSPERIRVHSGLDARVALRHIEGSFDQVVVDCYSNQFEIPSHLCTLEFFREARARLRDGGWLTVNLGGFGMEDPVVDSVARTCASAFDDAVCLVRVPLSRNFLLLARQNAAVPQGPAFLALVSAAPLRLGARALPGFSRTVAPDAEFAPLTDDWCPIEVLQLRSVAEAREWRRRG